MGADKEFNDALMKMANEMQFGNVPGFQESQAKGAFLTADDARKISGPKAVNYVETACLRIREEAEKGNHEVMLKGEDGFWLQGAYHQEPKWLCVKKRLEDLGFTVGYYFADLPKNGGTLIQW